MVELDLKYLKEKLEEYGSKLQKLEKTSYPEIILNSDDTSLIDENGNNIGTKGDMYHKIILDKILREGCYDINPRPHYKDGMKAHTLSVNHVSATYDLSKGESPLITLRPIAIKSSIGEILWIYKDASNDLDLLKEKYDITWWDEWDIGNRTIGDTYGSEVKEYDITRNILNEMKNNPDGRRHIMDLWQYRNFQNPHGLKPCAFLTIWNIRHGRDNKDYLDMTLKQRSSDFCTAGCINQFQYVALQYMFARHLNLNVGRFTWDCANVQIYDRHINQAIEMLYRKPINLEPKIEIDEDKKDFFDMEKDDVKVKEYSRKLIMEKNPQLKFEIAI